MTVSVTNLHILQELQLHKDCPYLSAERDVSHVDGLPGRLEVDVVRVVVLLGGVVAVADVQVVGAPHRAQEVAQLQGPRLQDCLLYIGLVFNLSLYRVTHLVGNNLPLT